jgi:hypothetical protein
MLLTGVMGSGPVARAEWHLAFALTRGAAAVKRRLARMRSEDRQHGKMDRVLRRNG